MQFKLYRHMGLYILMAFLLAGCLATPTFAPATVINQTSTPSPEPEHSLAITAFSEPTNTSVIPLSTIPTDANLSVVCVEITQNIPETLEAKDSILLLQDEDSRQVYLWNTRTQEKFLINKEEKELLSDFAVSPNGEWFVLIRSTVDGIVTQSSNLEIRSSNGELRKTMPIGIGVFVTYWLDNERLLLSHGLEPTSKQSVFNPFTGQQVELDLTFSDLYDLPVTNNRWGNTLIYDPSLTRVVYAGAPADIVLVDAKSKNTITRISPVSVHVATPKWSLDGQQLAIVYVDVLKPMNVPDQWIFELYSIGWDGRFTQLTNLSAYYDHPQIREFSWSPNGNYIAFWLESDPKKSSGIYEFSVLDLRTDKVTNYCIKTIPTSQIPALFWSPDNQWIALDVYDQSGKNSKDILVIDIINGSAAKVAENLDLLGWMAAP